jgi:hypothetical protein
MGEEQAGKIAVHALMISHDESLITADELIR